MPSHGIALWTFAVAVGLVLPLLAGLRGRSGTAPEIDWTRAEKLRQYYANGVFLLGVAAMAAAVWRFSGGTASGLGLDLAWPPARAWTPMLLVLLWVVLDTLRNLGPSHLEETRARWRRHTPFMPSERSEVKHALFLAFGAAVGEEIVYRGFMIGVLRVLFEGHAWGDVAAVLLPAIPFAVAHSYQGGRAVAKVLLLALAFGAAYVQGGVLWPLIAAHFALDAFMSWIGPRKIFLAADGSTEESCPTG